ncbi:hypothetical protein BD310DRAFT_924096 [Dichomitus squalens]|uniref:BTB domain-containing protein n=1 Tax=Dichomitus squalens TaxID=114155 RepID=A0A4Q9PZH4_9APHY|nr:hypothetical protein BD310DRAFT_924096 [Dichomitus squalens]
MSDSTPPVVEYAPYRDPSVGDLVIRTSDRTEFHVHQRRIADVSSVFADMLTLPPSPASTTTPKPIVDVSEPSTVWEKLLPICHVAEEPPLSLEDIGDLLEAARKYNMVGVTSRMRPFLMHYELIEQKPFAVYALACVAGFQDVARAAAQRTLRFPIYPPHAAQYRLVTAEALYRLFEYRQKCGDVAGSVLDCGNGFPRWMSHVHLDQLQRCNQHCSLPSTIDYRDGDYLCIPMPWKEYLRSLATALRSQPDANLPCDPSFLGPLMDGLSSCSNGQCSKKGWKASMYLSQAIKEEFEKKISEVKLVFEQ